MRTAPGTSGGCIVTGPSFANRDYQAGEQWERKAFVFRTPDTVGGGYLRFGQWMVRGKVFFDDVQLVPVQPLNTRVDGIELGDGERIARGRYQARLRFGYEGSNYSPCLQYSQAGFNSNRWTMGDGAFVIYRHRIGAYPQRSAECRVRSAHHESGRLVAEASNDGESWTEVGQLDDVGQIDAALPESLLPADEIYIRLRCEADEAGQGALQVHGYEYMAELDGDPPDAVGRTTFVELLQPSDNWQVVGLGDLLPGGDNRVELVAEGVGAKVDARLTVAGGECEPHGSRHSAGRRPSHVHGARCGSGGRRDAGIGQLRRPRHGAAHHLGGSTRPGHRYSAV